MCSLASYFISTQKKWFWDLIFRCVIGLVVIQTIYLILQYLNLDPVFDMVGFEGKNVDSTVGLSASPNQIGVFFANTSPLLYFVHPLFYVISLFGIMMSKTTSALIGSVIGVFSYIYLTKNVRQFFMFAVMLIVGASIFFGKFENINDRIIGERVRLWEHTISQVIDGEAHVERYGERLTITTNLLNGYGLGNFIRISPYTQEPVIMTEEVKAHVRLHGDGAKPQHVYGHAHNDLVEIFFELGLIGLVIWLLWAYDLYIRVTSLKLNKYILIPACCLTAHFVTGLGVFSVHTAVSGMLVVLMYGVLEGGLKNGQG